MLAAVVWIFVALGWVALGLFMVVYKVKERFGAANYRDAWTQLVLLWGTITPNPAAAACTFVLAVVFWPFIFFVDP